MRSTYLLRVCLDAAAFGDLEESVAGGRKTNAWGRALWLTTQGQSDVESISFALDRRGGMALFGVFRRGSKSDSRPNRPEALLDRFAGGGADALAADILTGESFVAIELEQQRVTLLRDPLGLATIYYRRIGASVYVSNSLLWLRQATGLSFAPVPEALRAFLIRGGHDPRSELTVQKHVHQVPSGHAAVISPIGARAMRVWDPCGADPVRRASRAEYVAEFRQRLADAVVDNMAREAPTWCDVSGGLDSSSVLALALEQTAPDDRWAVRGRSLVIDDVAGASEEDFMRAVADHFRIDVDYEKTSTVPQWSVMVEQAWPAWDVPGMSLLQYPEQERLSARMRGLGARVLLSGGGADHLLVPPHFLYLAELARTLQLRRACCELAHWIHRSRESALAFAWTRLMRPWLRLPRTRVTPPWLRGETAQVSTSRQREKRRVSRGQRLHAEHVVDAARYLVRQESVFHFERRVPFLDRAVVEYVVAIPESEVAGSPLPKGLLRDAIGPALPAIIQTKWAQPGGDGRFVSQMRRNVLWCRGLVQRGMLVDLGVVDGDDAAEHLGRLAQGDTTGAVQCASLLAAEIWLRLSQSERLANDWPLAS